MKKILLILLFTTAWMQGQTLPSPAYNNTTTNTLKIKTPATVTSVNFLTTVESDGSLAKIDPLNLPFATRKDIVHQSETFITPTAGTNIIGSPGSYESFPLLIRGISGKVLLFTRNGVTHTGTDGVINMRTSTDGGLTFSAKTTISVSPGIDCRDVSGGVTSTGRIVLFYLRVDASINYIDQGYIYSDNEGLTWSNYTPVGHGSFPAYSPYGKMIEVANNELIISWYAENGSGTNSLYIKRSTDNGATWGNDILVATGSVIKYSEAAFYYIGGKSILCVVRDDEPTGSMIQLKSTDNGATWVNQGALIFGYSSVSPELSGYIDENHERWISLFYADRSLNKMYAISGKASDLLLSASNWNLSSKTEFDSNSNYDFGYPSVIHSDLSPNYLVSYYKATTFYNDGIIYFKKVNLNPIANIKGSGNINYVSKFTSPTLLGNSSIFDNGTNVTVGSNIGTGVFNVFTGITGNTFNMSTQSNGIFSFSNSSVSAAAPTLSSKTNNNSGMVIVSGTPDSKTESDITFDVRRNNNTDFITLTNSAFTFNRFGIPLVDILRDGRVKITALAGTGTRQVVADANGRLSSGSTQPLKYVALITQAGTGAPAATVLENSLGGSVVWTRSTTGTYIGTLSGAFVSNKTACFITNGSTYSASPGSPPGIAASSTINEIKITTISSSGLADGITGGMFLEVRVYP